MAIADKINTYSVSVFQTDVLTYFRQIRLSLESGATAVIGFPKIRPNDWLQFNGANTILYLTEDEFADTYHLVQSESPVFFTALDLFGLRVGSVHTALDLSAGETPGEGDHDPQSFEAVLRQAKQREPAA
jgi:hypothetical protein